MSRTTHSARITGPVPYSQNSGEQLNIPLGPCLVERIDDEHVDIVWGASGQESAVLSMKDIESAALSRRLVLLD